MSLTVPRSETLDPDRRSRRDPGTLAAVTQHLDRLAPVLAHVQGQAARIAGWSEAMARCLVGGGRLLAAGNGGSAAEAQHLTAELVGRYDGDRRPFSAICLHGDSSSVTAIANDYGYDEVFARQVQAHARAGDIVVLMSGSGRSRNLLRAAEAARGAGATSWAMTGPGPNPLVEICDDALALPGLCGSVQEGHLLALHALCSGFEHHVRLLDGLAEAGSAAHGAAAAEDAA
jgi:type III pantothenate kinase